MARTGHTNDEDLLRRLEEQLAAVETQEIVRGLSPEDLGEKGFVRNGPVPVSRSVLSPREPMAAPGVEYLRLAPEQDPSALTVEQLESVGDVAAGDLLFTQRADADTRLIADDHVREETLAGEVRLFAAVNGKVLVVGDRVFVHPTDRDCWIRVSISADRMSATLECAPGHGGGQVLTEQAVLQVLAQDGVTFGVDREAVRQAVAAANRTGVRQEGTVVARGLPAVSGRNGSVNLRFDANPPAVDFRVLPDGRVDYRATCGIVMANKDDLLATITRPGPGTAGTAVTGESLPAADGEPAVLTAGVGVRVSPDGLSFYADRAGSIMLNGSVLEVLDTYVVDGDVDYASGNVIFNGNVVVNGTVLDGFEIKADGDVVVGKNVESARISAGRDVVVRGGVQGRGKGLVSAGRDIRVGYAQNARLEAQGDVHVENFAINSYIFSSRVLHATKGRGTIIGGEVYAQKGVEANVLGSENGVKTYVTTGNDFLVLRKIAEFDEAIAFCRANMAKLDMSLKQTARLLETGVQISAEKRGLLMRVIAKRRELEQSLKVMTARRSDLAKWVNDAEVCFVKVRRECHPDVYLKLKEQALVVSALRTAVHFRQNRRTGEVEAVAL